MISLRETMVTFNKISLVLGQMYETLVRTEPTNNDLQCWCSDLYTIIKPIQVKCLLWIIEPTINGLRKRSLYHCYTTNALMS